jgi:hypothetical protein
MIACGRCGAVGRATAFCASCGARLIAAQPAPYQAPASPAGQATAVPAPAVAPAWQRPDRDRLVAWLAVGSVAMAAVVLVGVVMLVMGAPPPACIGPACATPALAEPAPAAVPYTSQEYGYSLDAAGNCPRHLAGSTPTADGVRWTVRFPEFAVTDWPFEIRGERAAGRSAAQVVEQEVAQRYGAPTFVYSIPMADVGYVPGYGGVYDLQVGAGSGLPIHARAVVIAAVQGDLAIALTSLGPWTGAKVAHPNPAQTLIVVCAATVLTSVQWPGEPPP